MIAAVGDIHGQRNKLEQLLSQMKLDEIETLIFIGDYIDRGPDSPGTIELLLDVSKSVNCVFLRGNHEQMLLEARKHFEPNWNANVEPDPELYWFTNGGNLALKQYREQFGSKTSWSDSIPNPHWQFFLETEMEFGEGNYRFVHAGIMPPGKAWPHAHLNPKLWVREEFIDYQGDLGAKIVFGHTPQESGQPLVMANKIGIDTGAAYGGPLTAILIEGTEFSFVQA
ncbi:MAG: metallophosphoesterase family protein [Fimbriimonadaceae bacterium]